MKQKYFLKNIDTLKIAIDTPLLVFLSGDLGSGKTTFSKYLLNDILSVKEDIKSPTYTYYNKYKGVYNGKNIDIIHFDLYRIKNYNEFFAIAGEDILDNNDGIILIEWPSIINKYYKPDIEINFSRTEKKGEREVEIIYH